MQGTYRDGAGFYHPTLYTIPIYSRDILKPRGIMGGKVFCDVINREFRTWLHRNVNIDVNCSHNVSVY